MIIYPLPIFLVLEEVVAPEALQKPQVVSRQKAVEEVWSRRVVARKALAPVALSASLLERVLEFQEMLELKRQAAPLKLQAVVLMEIPAWGETQAPQPAPKPAFPGA